MNATVDNPPQSSRYLRDTAAFVRSWVRSPGKTGSVWPSSRYLAHEMTKVLSEFTAPNVAELGPGTGPLTACIQQRLARPSGGRHVAVELNADFAARLERRFPQVDVACDSAVELPRILKERDIATVDAVISGLPFAAFPLGLQREIMDGVVASMGSWSVFTTFTYVGAFGLPSARRFRALLSARFTEVSVSRPVIRNIPPAYVLTARGLRD